jgi:divalent metal cation (Fe/Co/Zn/Cd) transporter
VSISRAAAIRQGIRLELATVAWMSVEAVVAIGAGIASRSLLLTAFGIDSVVEVLSGVLLYRRLLAESSPSRGGDVDRLERGTVRISAVLLVALCAYVVLSSIAGLALRVIPEGSVLGVAVSIAALVAMPLLARAKRRVNETVQSPSLRADIAETVSCAYLAAVTLAGLLASMWLGWWWAQYVAALALLVWLVPEAREALEEWRHNWPINGGQG